MSRTLLAVAAMTVVAGCSTEQQAVAPPPSTAQPVEVTGLAGKECDLVSRDLLAEVDITVAGQGQDSVCQWDDATTKRALGVRLIGDHDPHMEVREPNAVNTDIAGFTARHIPEGRDRLCDVYVRTAPEQGFSVIYAIMDGTADDLCAGALKVADHVARRIQG